MKQYLRCVACLMCTALMLMAGCGGEAQQSKDKDFFTSGSREADQRADQRMAQKEELTGESSSGGGTVTKSQAVLATDKVALYDRLGGAGGIKLIVEDFVTRAIVDPRVNMQRVGVKRGGFTIHRGQSMEWDANTDNVGELKMHMEEFFALSTGGPPKYTGEDLKTVATNMHYTNANFDAAMGDLKATLDKLQIANQEQKEVLAVIETTREQLVEDR